MNETVKKCLHCGEPMQAGRSTKKYCSDSCKQAAFYNRAAQQVVTLDDNEPFNDSDDENEWFHKGTPVILTIVSECGGRLTAPLTNVSVAFCGMTRLGCSMSLKASGESPAKTRAV